MTVGIDLTEISRIQRLVNTTCFIKRFFSEEEQKLFNEKKDTLYQTVAGNFSAKEACVKAMGTGFTNVSPSEISVLRNELNKPYIKLVGNLSPLMLKYNFDVSITHTKTTAAAVVIMIEKTEIL